MTDRPKDNEEREERKPEYTTPVVVDLSKLARGTGLCVGGSFAATTCTLGAIPQPG